ncbi:MAG: nitrate/nitrite transporter NrtS [Roseivirga sp.]|nr:nitrate/nitrite transporter NrtS [Roseivirga sp.]
MGRLRNNKVITAMLEPSGLLVALKMSLVVGSILNCINQSECIFALDFEKLQLGKFLITYTVPFFVSLYTSTIIKLRSNS